MQNVCFSCCSPFSFPIHSPRFLPSCGHSLCSLCLQSLLSNPDPACPQCDTIFKSNEFSDFPPNLQLMGNITPHKPKKSIDFALATLTLNSNLRCLKHDRNFEAFCKLESKPICVSCLLENQHKFHEVISIKDACMEQKLKILEFYEESSEIAQKLRSELKEGVEKQKCSLKQEFEKTVEKIREVFTRAHQVLSEKQGEFEENLRKEFQRKDKEISLREMTVNSSLDFIEEFRREYNDIKKAKDLEILGWSLMKEPLFNELKSDKNRSIKPIMAGFETFVTKNCKLDSVLRKLSEVFKIGQNGKFFLEKVKVKGKENFLGSRENLTIMNTTINSGNKETSFLIEEQRKFHLKMATFT